MVYLCHANSGGFASIAYTNEGRDSDAMEHFDICRYWKDSIFVSRLPGHALRTLEVPVSSADAERAFSTYNKLVCTSGSRPSETGGAKFFYEIFRRLFRHFRKNFCIPKNIPH